MAIIPGALNTIAQLPDGFTGLGMKASYLSDANQTLLSTANDVNYITPTTARTITLPSTDPSTGKTVKQGRQLVFFNRSTFLLTINASNGSSLATANMSGNIYQGYIFLRANQDAPTTPAHWTVEALYEKGTWTPTVGGTTTDFATVTYSLQVGTFVRQNEMVFVQNDLRWTNTTGVAAGSLCVRGLPHVPIAAYHYFATGPSSLVLPASAISVYAETFLSNPFYALGVLRDAASSTSVVANSNGGAAARSIAASGWYRT